MQVRTVVISVEVANIRDSILLERACDPIVPIPIFEPPICSDVPFLQDPSISFLSFFRAFVRLKLSKVVLAGLPRQLNCAIEWR